MIAMDTADETLKDAGREPAENGERKEPRTWMPENDPREFEQFLVDIGLRF